MAFYRYGPYPELWGGVRNLSPMGADVGYPKGLPEVGELYLGQQFHREVSE